MDAWVHSTVQGVSSPGAFDRGDEIPRRREIPQGDRRLGRFPRVEARLARVGGRSRSLHSSAAPMSPFEAPRGRPRRASCTTAHRSGRSPRPGKASDLPCMGPPLRADAEGTWTTTIAPKMPDDPPRSRRATAARRRSPRPGESLDRVTGKAIETRGFFPFRAGRREADPLAIRSHENSARSVRGCPTAVNRLAMPLEDHLFPRQGPRAAITEPGRRSHAPKFRTLPPARGERRPRRLVGLDPRIRGRPEDPARERARIGDARRSAGGRDLAARRGRPPSARRGRRAHLRRSRPGRNEPRPARGPGRAPTIMRGGRHLGGARARSAGPLGAGRPRRRRRAHPPRRELHPGRGPPRIPQAPWERRSPTPRTGSRKARPTSSTRAPPTDRPERFPGVTSRRGGPTGPTPPGAHPGRRLHGRARSCAGPAFSHRALMRRPRRAPGACGTIGVPPRRPAPATRPAGVAELAGRADLAHHRPSNHGVLP